MKREVSQTTKAWTTAFFMVFMICLASALFADDATTASQNIYKVGWKIVNVVGGISAIVLIGRGFWFAQDLETHGRQFQNVLKGAAILAIGYALIAFVLYLGGNANTSVAGVGDALKLK